MMSYRASEQGRDKIKQARKRIGWAINDSIWLVEASKVLETGISWIETDDLVAYGILQSTWKRFLQGKEPIGSKAFQAFCQVLGLN